MVGGAVIGTVLLTLMAQSADDRRRPNDIVITARPRPPIKVIVQRVRMITRRTGDQVARFTEPVCPGVLGIPESFAGQIKTRMAAVAKAADVPTAGPKCRPNITLLIVSDGKQLLTELKRQKTAIFNAMPTQEVERALTEAGPVRVITTTELRSRDGNRLSPNYTQGNSDAFAGGASMLIVDSASIIHLATRQDISGSLVLLDTAAVIGKTINQLADYTMMRTLTKTNGVAHADDHTILSLFTDPTGSPPGLTSFDATFLKALYRGPATVPYLKKVRGIARQIAAEP